MHYPNVMDRSISYRAIDYKAAYSVGDMRVYVPLELDIHPGDMFRIDDGTCRRVLSIIIANGGNYKILNTEQV